MREMPNLLSLSLECVDLEVIESTFFMGSKLACLVLADNEDLQNIEAVDSLAQTLEELDLRETPLEKKQQRVAMLKKFPKLRES